MKQHTYIAIDLKSFYASVECRERGLDPMDTNLVVADERRTDKTICLAVTPSLKSYGISGRGRLFEVKQRVREANAGRRHNAPGRQLEGSSYSFSELQKNPALAIDFLIAPPRMAHYMAYSARIYQVYMKYIAPEDIVVYSIDEVFLDVTDYLRTYRLSPHDLARKIILDVLETTGITATAGIGTNLYLCKVAMDIVAKHIPADENGVRIAELDEMSYRRKLWAHQPLTDFWRVGRGYAKKLEENGMFTMGDVARRSLTDEDLLYQLFGKNAELLIDHAWGWEPCTIEAIKAHKPSVNSLGSSQVLHCPYEAEKARLVLREMADLLALDLVDKGLVTDQIVITVGYDIENLTDPARRKRYRGKIVTDHYGRKLPKHAHGTIHLDGYTASTRKIMGAAAELFDRIVDKSLLVRRLNIVAARVIPEAEALSKQDACEQLDLFTDYAALEQQREQERAALDRERRMQKTLLTIKKKFGKNAILRGMNLEDGATAKDRNAQIGGHKA
ncbi:MAG TPA: DNA methylase [Candidatus Butyricicoccus stercorigallinarum]|nr:DNA methylase [Candidatus Butyricicoccus stercorigallinarum]